ncbi:MAG: hypothetical protein ACK5HR_01665, partial [Mycoplasmatales bacterium]
MKIIIKIMGILMISVTIISNSSPIVVHGQEVYEDIEQNMQEKKVNKEEKIKERKTTGAEYAKNIAYGCA